MEFSKKQLQLIARLKKLVEQMSDNGIAICIDSEYNDIYVCNQKLYEGETVSCVENVASSLDMYEEDSRIVEADMERLDIPVNFSYDGFYGVLKSKARNRTYYRPCVCDDDGTNLDFSEPADLTEGAVFATRADSNAYMKAQGYKNWHNHEVIHDDLLMLMNPFVIDRDGEDTGVEL